MVLKRRSLVSTVLVLALTSFTVSTPAHAEAPVGQALPEPMTTTEIELVGGSARIGLQSDIAIVGVTWGAEVALPEAVELRTLSGGTWGAWQPMDPLDAENAAEADLVSAERATAPMSLTDVEAFEVRVIVSESDSASSAKQDTRGAANASEEPEDTLAGSRQVEGQPPVAGDDPDGLETPPESLGDPPALRDPMGNEPGSHEAVSQEPPTAQGGPGNYTVVVIDPRGREPATSLLDPGAETYVEHQSAAPQPRAQSSSIFDTGTSFGLEIHRRSAWGADERIRDKVPDPTAHYRGAVVHHTAHAASSTGANSYSKEQVPGLIRGFYQYHVSQGWGDIGYQILVDRFGRVWEGRWESLTRPIVAAQARGANNDTFGIAVIGTWDTTAPPVAAEDAVARTISWAFETFGVSGPHGSIRVPGHDYTGRTVPVISGHRHIGGTSCPGDALFARLGSIRSQVNAYMFPPMKAGMERRTGANRFATASAVAIAAHPRGASTVYVANGLDFPDALAGGALAGANGAPLLLTEAGSIPAETKKALTQLKPARIIVIGREGAVSKAVEKALRGMTESLTRIGGANRFETAALVALAEPRLGGTVYLASGEDFPDALSAVPVAARLGAPLLLTERNSLPIATRDALRKIKPERIVVVGGEGVVAPPLYRQLGSLASKTERYAGANRFATVAATALAEFPGGAATVYIAAGSPFADALSAGPAASLSGGPLLLVESASIPAPTAAALKKLRPKSIVIVGGTASVSTRTARALEAFLP